MSVSTEHTKDIIKGDGVIKTFPFSFAVLEKEQIKCIKIFASGEEVEILSSEFGVSINDNLIGGSVEYPLYDEPLGEDEQIVIYRKTEIKQDYKPVHAGALDTNALKLEIDRLTMIAQELGEEVARAVKTLIGSDAKPDDLLSQIVELLTEARKLNDDTKASAETAVNLSKDYAIKTDGKVVENDVEVDYSSKHYAGKSKESATDASISAINSANSATSAEKSAIDAAISAGATNIPILSILPSKRYLSGVEKVGYGLEGELVTSAYSKVIEHIEEDIATGTNQELVERQYSIYGTPTVDSDIASAFSTTSYAYSDFPIYIQQLGNNRGTFFIEGSFKTGANITTNQVMFTNYKTNFLLPALGITSTLRAYLSSDGVTWNMANNLAIPSSPTLIINTQYYYRYFCLGEYSIEGSETKYFDYVLGLSTDNQTWTYYPILSQRTTIVKGSQDGNDFMKMGLAFANASPFLGEIDLNDFKVIFLNKSYGQYLYDENPLSYDEIYDLIISDGNQVRKAITKTPYILAADGDKIIDIEHKQYMDYLYAKEKRGDFYVYDNVNKQVFLPRFNNKKLIVDYENGNHKVKLYSNGDYEEENYLLRGSIANPIINFSIPFIDTNYFIDLTQDWTAATTGEVYNILEITTKSVRVFKNGATPGLKWKVSGKADLSGLNLPLDLNYFRIGNQIRDPQYLLANEAVADIHKAVNVLENQTRMYPLLESGDISLESNRCYYTTLADVTRFSLPAVDRNILNQIFIDLQISGNFSIDWGTEEFSNGEAPDLSLNSTFSVYYEFSNVKNAWVVGVMSKERV